jgi:hypothetical protein
MKRFLTCALFVMALSATAYAQLNEGRNAPPRPGVLTVVGLPDTSVRPYSRSLTGKVLDVNGVDNLITVEVAKVGRFQFFVDKNTRLRADKKTELAGKKDLSLTDYKPSQTVKLTFRVEDNKVLEVRLKPPTN